MTPMEESKKRHELINGIIDGVVQGKKEVYNPVFFYGHPVRIRITMDRLEKKYREAHPQDLVIRTNAVDFICGFHDLLIDGHEAFHAREQYFKTARLLIFESAEALSGYVASMNAFYRIVDAIFESGGQVVYGATTTPKNMPSLEPRNQAQMEGGIICCVDRMLSDSSDALSGQPGFGE